MMKKLVKSNINNDNTVQTYAGCYCGCGCASSKLRYDAQVKGKKKAGK
ncbi:CLI_3235 family bacteriocin precursor [Lachnospiraceae bacterium MD308]|nr:CLI_3235 family bacteriocin precursor [Lachnospiraceae bacterium MD308]